MAYERVARLDELATSNRCVRVGGVEVGLFRVGDEVFAIENACPHAGYPLHEGEMRGHVVYCPAHGFDYDVRTGFAPDDDDGFPIPRFAVRIVEGFIEVDLDERVNERKRR